jgi:cytochrome c553
MMGIFVLKRLVSMKILFLGFSFFCVSNFAQAQSLQTQQWASACFSCHGTDGYSQGGMASLAGQAKTELIEKMNDYKTGKRVASIMHQISKGYTSEQIEKIAEYFAALPHDKALHKNHQ